MRIGCFALVKPFASMGEQFRAIREMGIEHADLTDNHEGGMLGVEFGFTSSVSLDSHPAKIRGMAAAAGVRLSAFCAHANLLDPVSPEVYSTHQIIKAVRLAHHLGIRHVITTEGDPKTEFGHALTHAERIFAIRERLYEPIRWAEELGVELLVEPHGIVTGNVESMDELLGALGHVETVGVCLDTGNSWLAGADPLDYVARFGQRIRHVHWKDMGPEWVSRRGSIYGCGMGSIPIGDGLVNAERVMEALLRAGFDGDTTIEAGGADNVRLSAERLRAWSARAVSA
ncbi:MAG TPA: sugar phosphate isomerase/epimerase [Solibacterales bacterium]|nr:sugar phosphate isomerase/epimerase [Bryobacterales bacterium]